MEGITIFVTLLASALIMASRPAAAVGIYLAALLWYPQALTVPIAGAEFNTGRFLILVLLAKGAFQCKGLSRYRWSAIDTWLVITFLFSTFAYTRNAPMNLVLVREAGAFFDTMLSYFAVRMLVERKSDFVTLIKWMVLTGIPLALLGAFESKTGHNPYNALAPYYSFGLAGVTAGYGETRHGFYRASGSLGNSIIFGMYFAAIVPLCIGVLYQKAWSRPLVFVLSGFLMLGALSSMSSAPLSSLVITFGMISLFGLRRYWPVGLTIFIAMLIFVEVYSNRHFYHVLSGFSFSEENAYYRIGLLEECFGGGMIGHWLFGYGYVGIGPGNINNDHFYWEHFDLVNIYIRRLAQMGLCGLLPYVAVNFLYYRRLWQAGSIAKRKQDKWLVWCLASGLVGWNIAMLTVSALTQTENLLYILIGVCANLPAMMRKEGAVPLRIPSPVTRNRFHRPSLRHRHV